MSDSKTIDQIFADTLSQMMPPPAESPEKKEQIVKMDNDTLDDGLPPVDGTPDEDEDLDALLESLTSKEVGAETENNGDLDQVLDEMFPSDAVETDDLESVAGTENTADDAALDDLVSSAMQIEDMPAENLPEESAPDLSADAGGDVISAALDGAPDTGISPASDDLPEETAKIPVDDLSALGDAGQVSDVADAESSDAVAENSDENNAIDDDAAAELNATLKSIGFDQDNELLYNNNSSDKERLLQHLAQRFEMLARRKLENLPPEQVKLVKSVNLRVDIELKFGEYSMSGDDDSIFQLDV